MEVFKFGGASVNSAAAIGNVVEILKHHAKHPCVLVFSAMGKTTNMLEDLLNTYVHKSGREQECMQKVWNMHRSVLNALFPDVHHEIYATVKTLFEHLQSDLFQVSAATYSKSYATIVSYGEKLSTLIISRYLEEQGLHNILVDACEIVKTDASYMEAKVDWNETQKCISEKLQPCFEKAPFVVTQGFIAARADVHEVTTLGREGSDYTASILAFCLGAESVSIWKDVPGVLNADPKYFSKTTKLSHISYLDATELAYFGASVIHPKTIKPLQNKSIPLRVRSFVHPEGEGTWVGLEDVEYDQIPSYIVKKDQLLLSVYPKDFSFIDEKNLMAIFEALSKNGIKVNMMQNSALSFSVCVDSNKGSYQDFIQQMREVFDVKYNQGLELITIRHYTQEVVEEILGDSEVLLEQRTRNTAQFVVSQR